MTLSVIIPAHGREELLVRCLRSLDRPVQGELGYEVCVVDDGSGLDEERVRAKASASYPLAWVAFPAPRGRSAARNQGVRFTTGEIVVFLDSDMEAREGFLRAHIEGHRSIPRTAFVGKILWPRGGGFYRYIGSRGAAKLAPGQHMPPWYFVTGNASVERADLPGNHPFDENLPGWGGEDLGLGLELEKAGVRFGYAPEAAAFHHFDGTLRGHVQRTNEYGRGALPILVAQYPELRDILRLHLLESPVWRFLISNPVFHPALFAADLLDTLPLPAKLYDYLTFAAYARGFLTHSGKAS
ncbi:MAG: glycosyltransferase family 2 protein [Candidatus Latescibacterota bacterium]